MVFGGGSLLIWYCVDDVVLAFLIVTFFCCCCFCSRFSAWFCCCVSFVVFVFGSCWFLLSESGWLSLFVLSSFVVEYRFLVLLTW